MTAAKPGGDTSYEWKGVKPYRGRYWAYSRAKMEQFETEGRLVYTSTGMPEYKRYLDEMPGRTPQSVWEDIPPVNSQAAERLGYPTQKPLALLERIVQASSNPGDVVLDPFCGCGTAIEAAQKLGRRWIGIDVTQLSIALIKKRLHDAFEGKADKEYTTIGEPTTAEDAARLAKDDPYQFQWWALGLCNARPVEQKKGADKGIDGRLYFHDDAESTRPKQVIFSVKAGNVSVPFVRDLRGVIEREKAEIGVLITMNEPTGPMKAEAAGSGHYVSPWDNKPYPRLQIRTVGELLSGRGLDLPPSGDFRTFKKAPKSAPKSGQSQMLAFDET